MDYLLRLTLIQRLLRHDQALVLVRAAREAGFKNLYLLTDLGQIDFLAEISGVGRFQDALGESVEVDISGVHCRMLTLDALIRSKRALGRPKDLHAVIELEALRERQGRSRD